MDALKKIARQVKYFIDPNKIIILITHYQRLLEYIVPDFIHIMNEGKIVFSGTAEIAKEIEENGYKNLIQS